MLVTLGKRLETQDQRPWLIGTRAKKGIRWTFRTLRMPWPVHHPLSTDSSGCSLETNEARRGQSLSQQRRSAFPWLGCACLGLWAPPACSSGLSARPGVKDQGFWPLLEAKPLPRTRSKRSQNSAVHGETGGGRGS